MKTNRWITVVTAIALFAAAAAQAQKVGQLAPDFSGTDSHGTPQTLTQYRGKYVVLEWHNQGCPFVKAQYNSGNMQALEKEWTGKGVVWLTMESSAQGKEGYVTAAEENSYLASEHAAPTAAILDASGKIGHAYEAKTSPHMFIIDPQGKLIYNGAIDDHPTTDKADPPKSKNYVSAALTAAMAGKPVEQAVTRPYGCSVKY
jgi:peroxiredoxin